MPETTIADRIENRIDKAVTGSLAVIGTGGAANIVPRSLSEVMEFSKTMALAGPCIRPQFRNNPGACLAMTMQSLRWGMDPFAVANKAYMVKNKAGDEQIAFEAQLIHAVVNERAPLQRRLRAEYSGEGPTRRCKIIGFLKGEDLPFEYESPEIGKIGVKNSPLWTADPDQQLFYYSTRAWARKIVPEILLGVYTDDEIVAQERYYDPNRAIDVTPARPTRGDKPTEVEPDPFVIAMWDGKEFPELDAAKAADLFISLLKEAAGRGREGVDALWESNTLSAQLRDRGWSDLAERCHTAYADALAAAVKPKPEAEVIPPGPGTIFDKR
jgi:hypothetical protein